MHQSLRAQRPWSQRHAVPSRDLRALLDEVWRERAKPADTMYLPEAVRDALQQNFSVLDTCPELLDAATEKFNGMRLVHEAHPDWGDRDVVITCGDSQYVVRDCIDPVDEGLFQPPPTPIRFSVDRVAEAKRQEEQSTTAVLMTQRPLLIRESPVPSADGVTAPQTGPRRRVRPRPPVTDEAVEAWINSESDED